MSALIEFDNVSYGYVEAPRMADTDARVVEDVSFCVNEGEFVSIVGTNGAGKTTVSKLMNGLLKPTQGEVRIDGVATSDMKTSALARTVGMLFQNPDRQICQQTVRAELAFSLKVQGVGDDEAKQRVERLAQEFNLPLDADPFSLSRGQRQNLALASVISASPRLLVLDEPTCGLDYRECTLIMQQVESLRNQGTTVVMISHDMELVFDHAQRVIAMAHGRIVADGQPEAVFRDVQACRKASIVAPQIIDVSLHLGQGTVQAQALGQVSTVHEMCELMRARGIDKRTPIRSGEGA